MPPANSDYHAFTHLWQNANSLADAGLQQLAADILQNAANAPAPTQDTFAAQEAQALAQLGNLDLSGMMDGLPWGGGEDTSLLSGCVEGLSADTQAGAPTTEADRIQALWELADMNKLETLLGGLRQDLPALTEPLEETDFAQWLADFRQGNPILDELVSYLCGLSAPGGRLQL